MTKRGGTHKGLVKQEAVKGILIMAFWLLN